MYGADPLPPTRCSSFNWATAFPPWKSKTAECQILQQDGASIAPWHFRHGKLLILSPAHYLYGTSIGPRPLSVEMRRSDDDIQKLLRASIGPRHCRRGNHGRRTTPSSKSSRFNWATAFPPWKF